MDADSWLLLLPLIFFILASAYFACAESGLSSVNPVKIKSRAEDGDRKAKNALFISNHFDRALTALLIGINVSHIAAASLATLLARHWFGGSVPEDRLTFFTTLVTTGAVFLFGEMIPKSLANDRSESVTCAVAGSLRFMMKLFSPLVTFFTWISGCFSKWFRGREEPTFTEEELYDILETVEEEGVVDEEQGDLMISALEFGDTTAADVMTMREDIQALDLTMSREEFLKRILDSTHSRFPVCDGGLDHVVGTLPVRNFMKAYMQNPDVGLRELLMEPFFVGPGAKIDDLLSEMRQRKFYLAIVRDKEDRTVGIVTIEDFLEELVGEIWDEDDVVDHNFAKIGGNHFLVNPKLPVGEVFHRMGRECPDARLAARPLLSWLFERFGRLPREEESFTEGDVTVTVRRVEEGKVTQVEIELPNPLAQETAEEPATDLSAPLNGKEA